MAEHHHWTPLLCCSNRSRNATHKHSPPTPAAPTTMTRLPHTNKALGLKTTLLTSSAARAARLAKRRHIASTLLLLPQCAAEKVGTGAVGGCATQQLCKDALHRGAMTGAAIWLVMRRRRTPSAFRSCLSCSEMPRVIRPWHDLVT
jgi:hypothetical protein